MDAVPNTLLTQARLRLHHPDRPNQPMTLADVVNAVNTVMYGDDQEKRRHSAFTVNYLRKLERGIIARPRTEEYIAALRTVLQVETDEELGFANPRASSLTEPRRLRPTHALDGKDANKACPEDRTSAYDQSARQDDAGLESPVDAVQSPRGATEVSTVPTRRDALGYAGAAMLCMNTSPPASGQQSGSRVRQALELTQREQDGSHDETVDNLGVLVEHYRKEFGAATPGTLYDEIVGVREFAATCLRQRPVSMNLVIAAGWLSNLLALTAHDLADRAAALVWSADAQRQGQRARHPELAGWAQQTRTIMAFYTGDAAGAVTHARRGQKLAPIGTVAHAQLAAQEMRAWAALGDADNMNTARVRADQAIRRLPEDAATSGAFSISLADDPPYTATSLLLLGRYAEATRATQRVITRFYSTTNPSGRQRRPAGFARTQLVLARAMVGLGDLDNAYAAGLEALAAGPLTWPVAVLASKLDRALSDRFSGTAEARDYHHRRVAALRTTPSPIGPPMDGIP